MKFALWFLGEVLMIAINLVVALVIALPLYAMFYVLILLQNIFKPYKEYEEYTG